LVEAYENATSTNAYASSTQSISIIQHPVVINEIAWAGTTATSSDQWIELYNNSTQSIDLSRLSLASTDIDFAIKLSGTISPHSYFLLERGRDQVVRDVSADMIYEATSATSLPDTGTQLSLVWNDTIIDQTPEIMCLDFPDREKFCFGWTAGQQNISMERLDPLQPGNNTDNWVSNLSYISSGSDSMGNPIFGTPRGKNSYGYLVNRGQPIDQPITLTFENSPYVIGRAGLRWKSMDQSTLKEHLQIPLL
jgi:hypothetical protein